MARRRLQLILATTTITVGLGVAPAAAQDLTDLTTTVQDTVTTVEETTTEAVDAVTTVEETTTATVDTVEETVSSSSSTTEESEAPLLDVDEGTGDGTLDVDLEVDVAPSDDDGSPQLEIDGRVTVADQTVDVGGVTDPIEDAVDPDPAPAPDQREPVDGGTSSDTTEPRTRRTGPGGFLEGGGVVAADNGTRPVEARGETPASSTLGSGFAPVGGLDRGRLGFTSPGGGTMAHDAAPDPDVARPATADASMESPQVLDPEAPAVFASGTAPGTTDGPMSGLLKALAAAMVLGAGVAWTRATREG